MSVSEANGKVRNRWIVLGAAAVSGLMAGITYVWSIYKIPLMELHGWSSNEVTLAYSLFALMMLAGTFAGGPLQRRFSARTIVVAGGLLQGGGLIATGFINSIAGLYLAYSFVTGAGNGIIYSAAVSTAVRWFPDKKGMANGLCVGCMGLGPLLFAPLGNWFIGNWGVSVAFQGIGAVTGIVLLVTAIFLCDPPQGWHPEGFGNASQSNEGSGRECSPAKMLKTPVFWVLWVSFALATSAGAMMTGQAAAIGQDMCSIDSNGATTLVAALAVASFTGRLGLGTLSDKIGRFATLVIACALTAFVLLFFMGGASTFGRYLVGMFAIGLGFGGIMASLPSVAGDMFGTATFPVNYPFFFSAYTAAMFVGPMLASEIFQTTGNYSGAFIAAGAMSVAAAVLFALVGAWLSRQAKEAPARGKEGRAG